MPEPHKEDGSIKWVVSGNSELGIRRAKWWDDRVKKMNFHNRAEVARAIHPKELKGLKPCQICGKKLSIFYVYPTKNTLKRIKKITKLSFNPYEEDIYKIFDILYKRYSEKVFDILRELFDIPVEIKNNREGFLGYILDHCETKLSPGVMSNPPDRFDGFHTYNACCRSREDTGRHKSNLARYSQDRRAYENWAGGDWNLSNRLIGEFNRFDKKLICPACGEKRKMTADHIGPISLGFTHRAKFNPICNSCNSGKNNRLTPKDMKLLIEDEQRGEEVVSWHSKYIWNELKTKIKNEKDALNLSKAMRLNLHNVLSLLSIIKDRGHIKFLMKYLHPEYSFVDYRFQRFHPLRLNELKIIKNPLDSKNKRKNASRYIRISLDSLDEYQQKKNRRVREFESPEINENIKELLNFLNNHNYNEAYKKVDEVIELLSKEAINNFF